MSQANVVHSQPPAPPGPATFDYGRFKGNAATTMVDTQTLTLNADVLNTCRVRAYGDPANPAAPAISAPAIATQIILAPSFGANGAPLFTPTVLFGNTCTYFPMALLVGEPVIPPAAPTWSLVKKGGVAVATGRSLGDQLGRGVIVGPGVLYCDGPRPSLPTDGSPIVDLDGGDVRGSAPVFA